MGIGSYLVLLNATPWPWSKTYQHSYQMNHWEDTLPDTINPGEQFTAYIEQSNNILDEAGDDGAEATYTFQNWDGDTAPSFQLQYRDDDGPQIFVDFETLSTLNNDAGSTLQLPWSHDRNTPFILASNGAEIVSSNPPEDWMHQTYDRISCLTLRQLCVPGTHDSGMSEFNAHTIDAQAYDTVTQYLGIGDQLINGARWFDVRPVISGGHFVTGHYSWVDVLGWQGGNGQEMQDVIDQVNSFTDSHQELVIIELTHGLNSDIFGSDEHGYQLTQDNWDDLLNMLLQINNRVLNMADVSDISGMQVSSFIGSTAAVIIIVDDQVDEDGTPVDLGDYANQGFFTKSQYYVYNSYADENDIQKVEDDQFEKMSSVRTSSDSQPFLLSWTSTWAANTLFTSITDLGDAINNKLWTDLWGRLSSDTYPNVIAVDAYTSTSRPFPALAMAINYYLAPTCSINVSPALSTVRSSLPQTNVMSSNVVQHNIVVPTGIASNSAASFVASFDTTPSDFVYSSALPSAVASEVAATSSPVSTSSALDWEFTLWKPLMIGGVFPVTMLYAFSSML